MANLGLVDQESVEQQRSSNFQGANQRRNQLAVQKTGINDRVVTVNRQRKGIEVGHQSGESGDFPRGAADASLSIAGQREINRMDGKPRCAPASANVARCPAAMSSARPRGSSGSISMTKGSGEPMPCSDGGSSQTGARILAHRARAIVSTSTARAPAARNDAAHALAVAPVVSTSSINSTLRPAIRSGYLTAKALWTFRAGFRSLEPSGAELLSPGPGS